MSKQIDDVINLAKSLIGTAEHPPKSNNVMFNTVYYGRNVSGPDYPWCVVFIWYLFNTAGLKDLFYGGAKTPSSTTLLTFARNNGLFVSSDYRPGDILFFSWSNPRNNYVADHVGLCIYSDGNSLDTIEGNTSPTNDTNGGEVMMRYRPLTNIIGAYRPKYQEDKTVIERDINKPSEWAVKPIQEMMDLGITDGTRPGAACTREEVLTMLHRLYNVVDMDIKTLYNVLGDISQRVECLE